MSGLKRIVLDVLKPNDPSVVELSRKLTDDASVENVDIVVVEIDRRVETIRLTITGDDIDFDKVKTILEKSGATIHSIDRVSRGASVVDTPAPLKKEVA